MSAAGQGSMAGWWWGAYARCYRRAALRYAITIDAYMPLQTCVYTRHSWSHLEIPGSQHLLRSLDIASDAYMLLQTFVYTRQSWLS